MIDEKQIQDWFLEEEILVKKLQDENANFHYIINYPNNKNFLDVISPKGKEDLLIIGCATEVSQEEISLMNNTKKSKRIDFLWNLRFSLNNFLLDFELDHPNDKLKRFIIHDQIFEDGLTKDRLMSTIRKIFKAKLHCIWLIGKTFGGPNAIDNEKQVPKDSMFV